MSSKNIHNVFAGKVEKKKLLLKFFFSACNLPKTFSLMTDKLGKTSRKLY